MWRSFNVYWKSFWSLSARIFLRIKSRLCHSRSAFFYFLAYFFFNLLPILWSTHELLNIRTFSSPEDFLTEVKTLHRSLLPRCSICIPSAFARIHHAYPIISSSFMMWYMLPYSFLFPRAFLFIWHITQRIRSQYHLSQTNSCR